MPLLPANWGSPSRASDFSDPGVAISRGKSEEISLGGCAAQNEQRFTILEPGRNLPADSWTKPKEIRPSESEEPPGLTLVHVQSLPNPESESIRV